MPSGGYPLARKWGWSQRPQRLHHRAVERSGEAIRGEVRSAAFRRVSHGLFLPIRRGLTPDTEFARELAAWRLVLPDDAVFTHVTAAYLYEWWMPRLPEFVPVFAAMGGASSRPRRAGLVCSRLERDGEHEVFIRHGFAVDTPAEVLLRAARDLGLLDLVIMIDRARGRGDITIEELERICRTPRPGVARLRQAVLFSDARSESAWEVALRVFHVLGGIPVEPQVDLFDDRGTFVARGDLLVLGTTFVHEYDGAVHDQPRRRTLDLRRDRRLSDAGFVRRGFTAPDLVGQPLVTLHELDRALGRPHRPQRLRPWLRWLDSSCFSVTGRLRLRNRWRISGHWSRTA